MQLEDDRGAQQPLAIATTFLEDNKLFQTEFAGLSLVVVTSDEGANRVYVRDDVKVCQAYGQPPGDGCDRSRLDGDRGRARRGG